jgi:HSP20 family protein
MYITKRNMQNNYRNVFDLFLNQNEEQTKCYKPATNILNNDDSVILDISAPGLEKKDFQINVKDDVLTIKYEKPEEDNVSYTHREFGNHSFCRSFSLSETIDIENIKANYTSGILNVVLPKKEEEKKAEKQIEIA